MKAHNVRQGVEDVNRVTSVVMHEKLWEVCKGRKHRQFASNPLKNLDKQRFKSWMTKKIKDSIKYKHIHSTMELSDSQSTDSDSD